MKRIFSILVLLIMPYFLFSQNWQKRNDNSNERNFHEIQKSFNNDYQNGMVKKSDRGYKQFKRWERFWKDRVLANGGFINPLHTFYEMNKYNAKHSFNGKDNKIMAEANWSFVGPDVMPDPVGNPGYPGLGRVNAIAFDPNDNSIIWVGSPSGGLWKSIDGGQNWATNTDGLPSLGISDIVIDPTDNQIMYIATGDADAQQTQSLGVMKSTDGGETWNLTSLNYELHQTRQTARMLIDAEYPTNLIVSTSNGIYFTDNAAETWTQSSGTDEISFNSLVYKADNPDIVFAGGLDGRIYMSDDNGHSFSAVHESDSEYGERVELAVTADSPDFIFAFFEDGSGAYSSDGGQAWDVQNMPQNEGENVNTQQGYNMCVAIAPDNADLMILGAMNFAYRTTDGGQTWEGYLDGYWEEGYPYFYVHSDHHVLKFLPGSSAILFSGNDGGLHKGDITTDDVWTDLTSGLFITQYYGFGGTPQNENYLLAGAQDNDVNGWDGTKWWDINNNTDGVECLIDYSNQDISYTASTSGNLSRTLDGYQTQEEYLDGPAEEQAGFEWPIVMDPITPTTLYGGWSEIYKTTDRGDSWEALTDSEIDIEEEGIWSFIAIAPSDPNYIFAGNTEKVFLTKNGGSKWTEVTGGDFPSGITKMTVNSTDPNTAYITFGGYDDGQKVYKTTDAGNSWTNISGSLPNVPVKCITFRTGANEDLYIGTDLGVYHLDNKLSDWEAFNTGLPTTIVNDLEIYYATNKIRAATFGRGIWQADLPEISGTDPVPDLLLPANGSIDIALVPDAFKWSATGSGSYRLQISKSADMSSPVIDQNSINEEQYQTTEPFENGVTYYWRVKVDEEEAKWSTVWNFTTISDGEIPAPVLVSPTNGAESVSIPVTFSWEANQNSDGYFLSVAKDEYFEELVFEDKFLEDNSFEYSDFEQGEMYYWTVATVVGEEGSDWADTWQFTTKSDTDLDTPISLFPEDGAEDVEISFSFEWEALPGADNYSIQVATEMNFSDNSLIIDDFELEETLYEVTELEYETMYYWRLNQSQAGQDSPWSETKSFTTKTETSVQETSPSIGFQVYPNPTDGVFHIFLNNSGNDIVIYNLAGGVVKQITNAGSGELKIDLSSYCKGLYFVSVKSINSHQTARVLIK